MHALRRGMMEGANERIQLEALLAQIMLIGCENR